MHLEVATWNVFHGRSQPPLHANLLPQFAAALAERPWDVCGLQEVPPWWADELGKRLGASVRTTRTSFMRAALPGLQAAVHRRDPERIDVKGAGANMLLIRPSAGRITDHRTHVLRRAPQRRTVHGVELTGSGGKTVWVCNVHAHNRPLAQAGADTQLALEVAGEWAEHSPVVLLGDLNLPDPAGLAAVAGFEVVFSQRVDHILARGATGSGTTFADRVQLPGGQTLSDHRLVGAGLTRG